MNEVTIIEVVMAIVAFYCLMAGLAIKWHNNLALFVYSCYFILSDIINPILFMNNESMYAYAGWGAVKDFDFSMASLIKSYHGSHFIFSVIVVLSILFSFSGILKKNVLPKKKESFIKSEISTTENNSKLYLFCFTLLVIYYFLYNNGIAITGLAGELPYHLSGGIHYLRIYIIPIFLAILIGRSQVGWGVISTVYLYAFVTGIAASSRLVVVITISILIFQLASKKRFLLVFVSLLFVVFMWFAVSTSRDLTFSGEQHNLFLVLYYAVAEILPENIFGTLDQLTGRLSGAQQVVLAYQYRGFESCSHIVNYFMGGQVCEDTLGDVYGLNLSGTSYGIGLSVIPSILISSKGLIGYLLPAVIIFMCISLTEYLYRVIISNIKHPSIGFLYFFLSITFLFTGPLVYYYYLQAVLFSVIIMYVLLKMLYQRRV